MMAFDAANEGCPMVKLFLVTPGQSRGRFSVGIGENEAVASGLPCSVFEVVFEVRVCRIRYQDKHRRTRRARKAIALTCPPGGLEYIYRGLGRTRRRTLALPTNRWADDTMDHCWRDAGAAGVETGDNANAQALAH